MFLVLLFVSLIGASPCDFFRPYIGRVEQCTVTGETTHMDANPGATPFGGMDVSGQGCRYIYSQKCCGIYPRACDPLQPPSQDPAFACRADAQNRSIADIYYIASYQLDQGRNAWILDPTSSVYGDRRGGLVNDQPEFKKLKVDGTDSPNPKGGDWQAKWTPRTATTNTQGLGPPGYMFVLSAKSLSWMTFYALAQKTINRGPENQFSPPGFDNCWYAEMDFLEAPFWSDGEGRRVCTIPGHPHASFFSTGSQFGGCFPMGTTLGKEFAGECNTEWCCDGTACPPQHKAFIDPSQYGYSPAGCVAADVPNPPAGTTFVGPRHDPSKCSNYNALGGCHSTSWMENEPNTEYTFAFVIDKKGAWVYRWFSGQDHIWPGISKFTSNDVIPILRPAVRPHKSSPPCLKEDSFCVLWNPSSLGEEPCVHAAGDINTLQHMGVATAEGKNWFELFMDTNQFWNYNSSIISTKTR